MNNGGSGALEEVMTLLLEPWLARVVRLIRLKGNQLLFLLRFLLRLRICGAAPAAVAESQIWGVEMTHFLSGHEFCCSTKRRGEEAARAVGPNTPLPGNITAPGDPDRTNASLQGAEVPLPMFRPPGKGTDAKSAWRTWRTGLVSGCVRVNLLLQTHSQPRPHPLRPPTQFFHLTLRSGPKIRALINFASTPPERASPGLSRSKFTSQRQTWNATKALFFPTIVHAPRAADLLPRHIPPPQERRHADRVRRSFVGTFPKRLQRLV